jgi:hypothetical protein
MTTSKMGIGVGSNRVGVAMGVAEELAAGLAGPRDVCVVMSVGEGSITGKACGTHVVQKTRIERERRDFIFTLMHPCLRG